MSLTAELLKVLDDEKQPLVKRLKIADNAFKSREISIPHREFVLLKWISELKNGDIAAWDQCYKWVSSNQVKELNRSDISVEDINFLLEMIVKNLTENSQAADYMVNIILSLIDNRVFQQHFKFDMKCYCNFVSNVITNINEENLLLKFIQNDQLFNKTLIGDDKFYKYFIEHVLISLSNAALKFDGNKVIIEAISKVLQKSIFRKNQKQFEEYFAYMFQEVETKEKCLIPKQLIKKLKAIYELDILQAQHAFQIIFHAFCSTYNNNFSLVFKFFVLLNINLGINVTSAFNILETTKPASTLSKSLSILSELLQVISKNNNTLDFKLNGVTFTDFLQTLILSIIAVTKHPNETCYKILQLIIEINPLIIESVINHVVVYIMLGDNRKYLSLYEKLFISIFEMYSKLHRIQNLVSKLIRSLESEFNGTNIKIEQTYEFEGIMDIDKNAYNEYEMKQLLPNVVMEYFANCIMSLASWQVMNLYKTLLFHLGDSVEKDLPSVGYDNKKKIFIEIICTLMCQFLSSVRIAEHTVATEVLKKFAKSMDDLKILLGKFGTALVSMEHNQTLMKAYLTVCYTWAELLIILRYYSLDDDITTNNEVDSDFAACNITYLHSYLTSEQWCLISERITNFGEKPCKQIMQNLCIQKLRAKMIFERDLSDDILLPVTQIASARLEDYYNCLINDRFSLTTIVNRMDHNTILQFSDYLLTDIDSGNNNIFHTIKDSKPLLYGIVYSCMERINSLFKLKRKLDQNIVGKFHSSRVFTEISNQNFNFKNTNNILNILKDSIASKEKVIDFKIDEEKFKQFLQVIKRLPVVYFEDDMKTILFAYVSSLLIDLNNLKIDNQLINDVENILKELIILGNIPMVTILKGHTLMKFITNNMKDYKDVFENISDYCIKNEAQITELEPCIKYITDDLSKINNMYSCITIINLIQKHKKSKLSEIVKKKLDLYKNQICESVTQDISQNKNYKSIHAFALVLKIYLDSNDTEKIEIMKKELLTILDTRLKQEAVIEDQTGWITLFITILQNKTKFEKLMKPDFILNIWNVSNRLDVNNEDTELYAKLIVEIFEHIPNEHFKNVSKDLVENSKSALIDDNIGLFMKYLKIWNSILTCCFNPTKSEIWQNSIQGLLAFVCFEYAAKNDVIWEEVINFETKLIQNSFLIITPTTLDIIFYTITQIIEDENNFHKNFSSSITLLESLLKNRKPLLYDRLPSYLQQYRLLIKKLCIKSNSNVAANVELLQETSNCAHQLEKLTKQLISLNKHVASICMYVIADILQHYETITLYPAVKIHIDNCLYSLISLCDQHAIACLMRVLSTASTEIFKLIYETYKKYYRFVGKV